MDPTTSIDFPDSADAHDSSLPGPVDPCFARFRTDVAGPAALEYGTYRSSDVRDAVIDVRAMPDGRVPAGQEPFTAAPSPEYFTVIGT